MRVQDFLAHMNTCWRLAGMIQAVPLQAMLAEIDPDSGAYSRQAHELSWHDDVELLRALEQARSAIERLTQSRDRIRAADPFGLPPLAG